MGTTGKFIAQYLYHVVSKSLLKYLMCLRGQIKWGSNSLGN